MTLVVKLKLDLEIIHEVWFLLEQRQWSMSTIILRERRVKSNAKSEDRLTTLSEEVRTTF